MGQNSVFCLLGNKVINLGSDTLGNPILLHKGRSYVITTVMTLLGKTSVVILLENQLQKQEEPVHQWRQKTKSRNQTKKKIKRTSNKTPVNFDSNKSTRSATFSDTSNNNDGNELRLAATILDECETEVKIFKIVKFHGKKIPCFFR